MDLQNVLVDTISHCMLIVSYTEMEEYFSCNPMQTYLGVNTTELGGIWWDIYIYPGKYVYDYDISTDMISVVEQLLCSKIVLIKLIKT